MRLITSPEITRCRDRKGAGHMAKVREASSELARTSVLNERVGSLPPGSCLEPLLSPHRPMLLQRMAQGDGSLPAEFERLSSEEREEVHDAREECRVP